VTATDACDASPEIAATPASGGLFPFGTTTVFATATDDSGGGTSCSFTVTVLTPQAQIEDLIAQINALVSEGVLPANRAKPLITKVEAVLAKLDGEQLGAACNQLDAFVNQVHAYVASGALPPEDGQALIDSANAIEINLGC